MDRDNLKIVLSFPRVSHEELTPMTKQVIRSLMDFASPKEKAKLILQATSGLRNQEVCALRKKDIQTNFGRWIIHVSHESAKYKKARISFLSLEAQRFLEPIIRDLKPDDLIFVSPTISLRNAKNSEIQKFIRLRKLVGLDERYKTNNFGKYTTHGLRSFFITQSDKIHEGFGHALAGHGQRYMVQYERFTLDEKLNFYLEVEPSLAIYDNIDVSSKDNRISNLEKQVDSMKSYIEALQSRIDFQIKV